MDQILGTGHTVTLVHFTYQHRQEGSTKDEWRIACMPNMTEMHKTKYHPAYHRSNDTRAVSCPACKKTSVFEQTHIALGALLDRIKNG